MPHCPSPSPPPVGAQVPHAAETSRCNVAVVSHGEYIPTRTTAAAVHIKAALSKAAWWPWPLILKVVSESRLTWATSVPILVFLGLSVLELGPMYATDVRRASSLNASALLGQRHNNFATVINDFCQTGSLFICLLIVGEKSDTGWEPSAVVFIETVAGLHDGWAHNIGILAQANTWLYFTARRPTVQTLTPSISLRDSGLHAQRGQYVTWLNWSSNWWRSGLT